ncbi:sulfate ABC transporter permease subunit CysW [Moraxella haemolytica]|uniref:sulfate ABC transporter permease subunit CysW n=1 Tax=Moraxella haemolytica TaxID=2904119 RepID=UPI002542D0B2|nr:sulfate ABC transporter permease subunit CysW [Moraxella sp. ZY171148]WII94417.1 sulfate ABC transporter permease subunit CysW [Moraxella sp. ZY171148]
MASQSTYDYQAHPATKDATWMKWLLIAFAVGFMTIMLVIPLITVFYEALKEGWEAYVIALSDPDALHAIKLTLMTTAIVLPINIIIGVALAYLITRHKFRGKFIITTLLDLPFAVSPVVAGLMFVLLFGANTLIGGFFESMGVKIIFATTGIVLATLFVTFPFIAREIIPLMQSIGDSEEEAALTLGANGWQMFWHITLPNIKWALLYGIILTNARAMGEFGAVSVVSGHIRGQTNTMPLMIEIAYNEYAFTTAFAMSSLLVLLALITLAVQNIMARKKAT